MSRPETDYNICGLEVSRCPRKATGIHLLFNGARLKTNLSGLDDNIFEYTSVRTLKGLLLHPVVFNVQHVKKLVH